MSRLKTLSKYVLWVVLFFIFSEFLIHMSIATSYRPIGRKDSLSQVTVYQAEATRVNGRMKGTIENTSQKPVGTKYLQIDFYSPRGQNLGTEYIEINSELEEKQEFELFFKLENISYYEISFAEKKVQTDTDIEILPKDLTRPEIIVAALFTLIFFL